MTTLREQAFESSIGRITLLSSPVGICLVHIGGEPGESYRRFIARFFPDASVERGGEVNAEAARQIPAYLDGRLTAFDVPLDLRTTPFYGRVLNEVKRIPFGRTKTYGDIAAALGKPGSSRAVGGANAANPIPLFISCHRVLASNGLGGYGPGLPIKLKLLRLEGIDFLGVRNVLT